MLPSPARWRRPFGRWVRGFSTRALATGLTRRGFSVSQIAVYHWVAGRNSPRPGVALAMVEMSRGTLNLTDIYRQSAAVRQTAGPPSVCGPGAPCRTRARHTTTGLG